PEKLLATILIGNNLVNVMIVVVLAFALNQMMTINNPVLDFVLLTVILTFLILLFGEVLPKLYANSNNVRFALFTQPLLGAMVVLFSPISKLVVKSTYIVRKAVSKKADDISVEDLSRALEASDLKSTDEKQMLRGILTFGDKTVSEIMRPRVDVVDIDIELGFDDVVKTVVESGYSRMPVYDESPDNIKGVLYAKDLLPYIGKKDDSFKWQSLMRPAYFVPESRMIDDLLEDFRKKKIHMAIIVDEFGCTQGIATLEDVLEEIVGDIDDEYDTEEKYFTRVAENTYIFDAKTPLDDFFEATCIDEENFADHLDDAETLAGLLLSLKGDFLKEKEELKTEPCTFTVLKVKKYRIAKVKVEVNPEFVMTNPDNNNNN
ncbi:MAG: gliding motility-associated protein GldE, partial [Muribaculaceae bacterium]|nr:gliding motility-associated protein GldE [Muribaculaceae bacterium]